MASIIDTASNDDKCEDLFRNAPYNKLAFEDFDEIRPLSVFSSPES